MAAKFVVFVSHAKYTNGLDGPPQEMMAAFAVFAPETPAARPWSTIVATVS